MAEKRQPTYDLEAFKAAFISVEKLPLWRLTASACW